MFPPSLVTECYSDSTEALHRETDLNAKFVSEIAFIICKSPWNVAKSYTLTPFSPAKNPANTCSFLAVLLGRGGNNRRLLPGQMTLQWTLFIGSSSDQQQWEFSNPDWCGNLQHFSDDDVWRNPCTTAISARNVPRLWSSNSRTSFSLHWVCTLWNRLPRCSSNVYECFWHHKSKRNPGLWAVRMPQNQSPITSVFKKALCTHCENRSKHRTEGFGSWK